MSRRLPGRHGVAVLGPLTLSLFVISCGSNAPPLYPVRGQVFFENQPAAGATVVFHAGEANTHKPSGVVGADGSFTLSTFPHGDGAPAGEYTVAVTWYPPGAREEATPKSKLPARYANPITSNLKASVKPADNTLEPFKLTK